MSLNLRFAALFIDLYICIFIYMHAYIYICRKQSKSEIQHSVLDIFVTSTTHPINIYIHTRVCTHSDLYHKTEVTKS